MHKQVILIGDRPNPRKNVDLKVPFVGTPSYKVILEWLYRMDVDITRVSTRNAYTVSGRNQLLNLPQDLSQVKIVALGDNASERLKEEGLPLKSWFVLPHPSPRNFVLNDKKYLTSRLIACKKYIYGENI
jgi:hypothetical protein